MATMPAPLRHWACSRRSVPNSIAPARIPPIFWPPWKENFDAASTHRPGEERRTSTKLRRQRPGARPCTPTRRRSPRHGGTTWRRSSIQGRSLVSPSRPTGVIALIYSISMPCVPGSNARRFGLQALVMADGRASPSSVPWHWPLQVGVPAGAEGAGILATLREAQDHRTWVADLSQCFTVGERARRLRPIDSGADRGGANPRTGSDAHSRQLHCLP